MESIEQSIVEFYEERAGILEFLSMAIRPFAEDTAVEMTAKEFSLTEDQVRSVLNGGRVSEVHDDQ